VYHVGRMSKTDRLKLFPVKSGASREWGASMAIGGFGATCGNLSVGLTPRSWSHEDLPFI
jgi:hypothetical protein